ncbi:arylalkylamine N-acetyltransferase-like 2 isoform X2 [Hetaerina americana]
MGTNNNDAISFAIITEDRFSDVISHLRANFFFDEPLNRAVGLCPHPGAPHAELESMSLSTMKQGLSLMATLGEEDRVVGVALNGVTRPGDLEVAERQLAHSPDPKFRRIFGLLNDANKELSLFERYNVDRIFELRIVSVDSIVRGRGLSNELMRRSVELARSKGFRLIKADTTGNFSQKMAAHSGLEPIHTVMYDEYKDSDGKIIFPTSPPHDSLKIMVKLLQ